MDQSKNWQIFIDDGNDIWVNILDCALVINFFNSQPNEFPQIIETPEKNEIPKEFFNADSLPDVARDLVATSETVLIEEEPAKKESTNIDSVSNEELTNAERRMHPRFDIRLRVIIKNGKNTYLTFTRDVSLGGLSLMNDVPEYIFSSEAEIYITAPDQKNNIMFTCSPIASKLGKSRLMFTKIEEPKQKMLAQWLQQHVQPNSKRVS